MAWHLASDIKKDPTPKLPSFLISSSCKMCHLVFHYSASEPGQAHKLCMHVHAWIFPREQCPDWILLRFLEAINLDLIVAPEENFNLESRCMHACVVAFFLGPTTWRASSTSIMSHIELNSFSYLLLTNPHAL